MESWRLTLFCFGRRIWRGSTGRLRVIVRRLWWGSSWVLGRRRVYLELIRGIRETGMKSFRRARSCLQLLFMSECREIELIQRYITILSKQQKKEQCKSSIEPSPPWTPTTTPNNKFSSTTKSSSVSPSTNPQTSKTSAEKTKTPPSSPATKTSKDSKFFNNLTFPISTFCLPVWLTSEATGLSLRL